MFLSTRFPPPTPTTRPRKSLIMRGFSDQLALFPPFSRFSTPALKSFSAWKRVRAALDGLPARSAWRSPILIPAISGLSTMVSPFIKICELCAFSRRLQGEVGEVFSGQRGGAAKVHGGKRGLLLGARASSPAERGHALPRARRPRPQCHARAATDHL